MIAPIESRVRANGLSHHVLTWGDDPRPPIVIAHGFLDHAWSFRDVARAIVDGGRRAIVFSWRGHGETEWIGAGGYYHFPDYVLDLVELLPQLAPDIPQSGVHLVGHSMGGTACALFAGTRPSVLRSLALCEGLGPPTSPQTEGEAIVDRAMAFLTSVARERAKVQKPMRDLDEVVKRMRVQHPDLGGELARFVAEKGTRAIDGGLAWRFDPLHRTTAPTPFRLEGLRAMLARIEVPVLLVRGTRGYLNEDHDARAGAIPDRRELVLEGAGHMMHWDAPLPLAAALLDHAARVDARGEGAG